MTPVYVAVIETQYRIVAVGRTPDEARDAATDLYIANHRDAHPDRTLVRDAANVFGPLVPGQAVSE